MQARLIFRKILFATLALLLASCGTFEVGVEVTATPTRRVETTATPRATVQASPTPEPTQTPLDDNAAIRAALADKLGDLPEAAQVQITWNTGAHAYGVVSNGYFLAARDGESWVIVYDGQATPGCQEVDAYQFPTDMVPECLDTNLNLVVRSGESTGNGAMLESLPCQGASPPGAESVACNIQDGLRSRNISALLGYMGDPFLLGYWESEGVQNTPEIILAMLPDLYNFNAPDYTPTLTFTTDRARFPPLGGRSPESIVNPELDVRLVVYSEGWEPDGQGAALIYIAQDSAGRYYWPAMIYAGTRFDK